MVKSPGTSLTIRLTPRKDVGVSALVHRGIEGRERIYTQLEAVDYLQNAIATDDVVAKASSEIESFKKLPNQTAVQFDEIPKNKALLYGDTFSEQYKKSIFVQGLPLNVGDNMHMYLASIFTVHVSQLAENADVLVQLDSNKPSPSRTFEPISNRLDSQRDRPRD